MWLGASDDTHLAGRCSIIKNHTTRKINPPLKGTDEHQCIHRCTVFLWMLQDAMDNTQVHSIWADATEDTVQDG